MHRQPASAGTFPVTAAVLRTAIRETPCVINYVQAANRNIMVTYTIYKEKIKQSRNRPGVAQRAPGGLGSQISMTFGT